MSQKNYLFLLKAGLALAFLSLFLTFSTFLFPYISSKQIYFNILIEVLLVVWAVAILKFPALRPKKFWVTRGLMAFLGVVLLSCFFSVDFNLSFWGDIERMLGFWQLFHFFIFYLLVITALREKKDWQLILTILVLSATAISLLALRKIDGGISTLGNRAYVAGYIIFGLYFAAWLFFWDKRPQRYVYLAAAVLMLPGFFSTGISGAFVGLGFSILCFLLIYGILIGGKTRKIVLISFIVLSALTIVAFTNKQAPVFRSIAPLQDISIKKNTFQTRLISWRAGLTDFKNHPILGVGHGNYAIIFDQYFSPDFYNYSRGETYFDRAHNNVIDILSTTGVLGLATYLSILIFAIFYLIKLLKKKKINSFQFSLLVALLIAYFVQNLAIFDSLSTYMGLFLLLGLIYYLRYFSGDDEETLLDQKGDGSDWVWLVIGLLIMLIPIWKLNVMPAKMMTRSIEGYVALSNGDVAGGSALYKEAFSYQTPWDRDSYTNFVYLVSNNYTVLSQLNPELLAYTIEIAQKDVAYNPKDTINQSNLAKIFNIGAKYYRSDQAKAHEYSVQAITAIDQAIASSPGRITLYFLRSQIYMTDNQADKALADLQYALSLNQNYYDSHCHLGKLYLQLNNFNEAGPFLDYCLDQGGVNLFEPSMVKMAINYYIDQNNTEKILVLYEELVSYEPKEVDHWINLAKLYHVFGRLPEAAAAAEEAAKLDPALQAEVDQFIQGLQ